MVYIPRSKINSNWCCFLVVFRIRIFQNGIVNQKSIKQLVKFELKPHTGIINFSNRIVDIVSYLVTRKITNMIKR